MSSHLCIQLFTETHISSRTSDNDFNFTARNAVSSNNKLLLPKNQSRLINYVYSKLASILKDIILLFCLFAFPPVN